MNWSRRRRVKTGKTFSRNAGTSFVASGTLARSASALGKYSRKQLFFRWKFRLGMPPDRPRESFPRSVPKQLQTHDFVVFLASRHPARTAGFSGCSEKGATCAGSRVSTKDVPAFSES